MSKDIDVNVFNSKFDDFELKFGFDLDLEIKLARSFAWSLLREWALAEPPTETRGSRRLADLGSVSVEKLECSHI